MKNVTRLLKRISRSTIIVGVGTLLIAPMTHLILTMQKELWESVGTRERVQAL